MPRLSLIAVATVALIASAEVAEAQRRNPSYRGVPRGVSARTFSGMYQSTRPRNVPTFSLPVYGGGFYRAPFRGGFYRQPLYQPVVVYPPVVRFGF